MTRLLIASALLGGMAAAQTPPDPAAWGSDHVGKAVPEYTQGDECLFCHRSEIGNAWQRNAHRTTMMQREDAAALLELLAGDPRTAALAKQVTHTLGYRKHVRFLKQDGYGKYDILNVRMDLTPERKVSAMVNADAAKWEGSGKFAGRCAGCHATAVDPATKAASGIGHDCYVCHGVVDLEHTSDTSKIFLSKKQRSDAKAITATCAACHLRDFAKSRSTGLPYANNFVPGDNLFRDYQVDWSKAEDATLNPGDRHVYRNVKEVMLDGSDLTCLGCHSLHKSDTLKHRRVLTNPGCQDCHNATGPKSAVKQYEVHSAVCEY